jgi:ElaB/YqjD/DUF883 family membrane-anchored ribosome-binding protein
METRYQGLPADTQKLAEDLKTVAHDVEELLKATGSDISDKAREIQQHLSQTLEGAQATAQEIQDQAAAQVRAVDRAVRENPYKSIGIALGAGLLVGILVARK